MIAKHVLLGQVEALASDPDTVRMNERRDAR